MKLKEIEQNIFGKPNCGSKLLIIDYGKSMIKAILYEFSGEWLFQYSDRAYRIFHGDSKKDNFSRTFIHVCAYHFLQMGRRKIKKILKITRNNPQIHFVQQFFGRLICYIGVEEVRRFVKDIYIVLNTKRSTDLVEYHIPCKTDEEKFNNFDYGKADLIELKILTKMIIYSSMVNWQKMKMRKRVYHQQINSYQSLGKLLESTIFRLSKMCIESKSSDIHNPYYMSVSFLT